MCVYTCTYVWASVCDILGIPQLQKTASFDKLLFLLCRSRLGFSIGVFEAAAEKTFT